MPKEKLIELKPGKGLDSGIYPSAEASAGAVWRTATNAWFRDLHIEAVPGRTKIVSSISRAAKCLAQAWADGAARLYYEDLGVVYYYDGGAPVILGALNSAGAYSFVPYGTWLLATDNVNLLKVWKNSGSFITAGDVASQFATAKIIKKLAQHVLAYNTDVYPNGFHWCAASDPDTWTPSATNSAGALPLRDLDSDIVAVAPLGAAHAVYSGNYLVPVQYVGPGNWFGTPNQALKGIGAVSKDAVVSLGRQNWGLARSGVFATDGLSFIYPDRPAIDRWLQENVDWSRADEVVGYFNDQLQLVVWTIPLLTGGLTTLAVDPRTKSLVGGSTGEKRDSGMRTFTFLTEQASFGIDRTVFNYPIITKSEGVYLNSVSGTVDTGFTLTSHLFDAGVQDYYKHWDYIMLEGTLSGEIRVGFADEPDADQLEWGAWQDMAYHVPLAGRDSIFFALDFRTDEALKLSGITVFGEKAGLVT